MAWFKPNGAKNNHNGSLITLHHVVKKYRSLAGEVTALKGIDLQVKPGEFLIVKGKSGAGKTTLVNMITGLDRCTAGEIWVAGTPVHQLQPEKAARWRGQTVGVVFQTFELLPTLTVLQNVTLPMDFANRYSLRQQRKRALHLLEQVEIAEHAYKLPSAEPTGSLDSVTSEAVIDVFEELVHQGTTVVLVTHDEDVARRGGRIITLTDGEMMADHNQEVTHA
jgi:putative ABC transport system ATP-binding protein